MLNLRVCLRLKAMSHTDGIQAVEAGHHLYTTNPQNTQPGWSERSAGDAPMERISRASPSSASVGVLRLVEVGAEIAIRDFRFWR